MGHRAGRGSFAMSSREKREHRLEKAVSVCEKPVVVREKGTYAGILASSSLGSRST
jgi:hypothetical protein